MKDKFITLVLIPVILLAGCNGKVQTPIGSIDISQPQINTSNIEYEFNELKLATAIVLANGIKNLPTINSSKLNTMQDINDFVKNVNSVIEVSNKNLGTNFQKIKVEQVSDAAVFIENYGPLIEPYNSLIASANQLNPDDDASLNELYANTALLGTDIFLVQTGGIHKTTFKLVGVLNNELKIAKIRNLCGNECHSLFLKRLYTFINVNLGSVTESFESWIKQFIY